MVTINAQHNWDRKNNILITGLATIIYLFKEGLLVMYNSPMEFAQRLQIQKKSIRNFPEEIW